jgi:iron complex transport system substrate-binding protein
VQTTKAPRRHLAHRLTTVAVTVAVAAMLFACGSDDSADADADTDPETDTATDDTAAADAFPVTITHAYGEVTLEAPPERVVTLGAGDLAVANALGANIVAAVKNFELPYLQPDVDPAVYSLTATEPTAPLNVEAVASKEPDLILATSSNQIDEATYASLSEIAPVVTYEEALYEAPRNEDALVIGRALGDEEGAEELIAEADDAVAALRQELPGIEGKTYLFGQARGDVIPLVIGKENQSTKFMAELGLSVPDAFADAAAGDTLAPGTIGISYEQATQLDTADVLFMTFPGEADKTTFESSPVVQSLSIVKDGRYHGVSLETAVALQGPNVVAVPWLLEQLRPSLEGIAE